MKSFLKPARYIVEAVLLAAIMLFFRLLPLDTASALGGRIGRLIGPLLRAHRVARGNLQRVFPEYSDYRIRDILGGMWENLGRVAAEYPHLSSPRMRRRITIEGAEYLVQARDEKRSAIFVSGHFANWEMLPMVGVIYELPTLFIYRAANNPYADKIIQWMRGPYRHLLIGKGREGAQQMITALRGGQCVAMLADQKLNEGELVPFFGHPAKTALAGTKMAIKFNVPLHAMRMVRTGGGYFHATVTPSLLCEDTGDATALMQKVHALFEQWIREHPEQWFWVHNRWSWKEA